MKIANDSVCRSVPEKLWAVSQQLLRCEGSLRFPWSKLINFQRSGDDSPSAHVGNGNGVAVHGTVSQEFFEMR
jgi:hypothetical protein